METENKSNYMCDAEFLEQLDNNLMQEEQAHTEYFDWWKQTIIPHTFRHTFATRCLEAGVKPKTIQSYLGHATLEMTMNLYVHTTDNVKQEEIELLEQNINVLRSSDYIDSALQKAAGSDNIVRMPNNQ